MEYCGLPCPRPQHAQRCAVRREPHVATAAFATKVPSELVLKEEKLLEGVIDPEEILAVRRKEYPEIFDLALFLPKAKTLRQTFKGANHSLNYGLGYKQFALRNEISEVEGKTIYQLYHTQAYPGCRRPSRLV